jgi:hypothetical protein
MEDGKPGDAVGGVRRSLLPRRSDDAYGSFVLEPGSG